jgi:hypothetical protein
MPLLSPTVNGATVGVDSTDAEDGDAPDDTDDSTFERLTGEADPERFDRTFLAQSDSFQIGGAVTSPAPFPLQVLPRVAYVINYNVVYDEARDKWVPQHPFSDEGLLREVLDSGASVETEALDLDFGTNLSASTAGDDPATVTVDASGGGATVIFDDTFDLAFDGRASTLLGIGGPDLNGDVLRAAASLVSPNSSFDYWFAHDVEHGSGEIAADTGFGTWVGWDDSASDYRVFAQMDNDAGGEIRVKVFRE